MKNSTFTHQVRAHLAVLFKSVMILMMLATVVPSMAAVGDTFTQGKIKYTVLSESGSTGTVSASKAVKFIYGELTIPKKVVNNNISYVVTTIPKSAFFCLA
ncbi:MAG: hypothetical protein PUF37_00935 [Prevotellaceae bacterium]|nr:hypothetical protein [Prevotellaceae bacterium]